VSAPISDTPDAPIAESPADAPIIDTTLIEATVAEATEAAEAVTEPSTESGADTPATTEG
jgi:hypothetical protein